jgi:hypothetical protein
MPYTGVASNEADFTEEETGSSHSLLAPPAPPRAARSSSSPPGGTGAVLPIAQSARVHPTALIAPDAEVGDNVEVGAYTILEGPVRLGPGCVIRSASAPGPGSGWAPAPATRHPGGPGREPATGAPRRRHPF